MPYRAWRWFWQYAGPLVGLFSIGKIFDYTVQDALTTGGHLWSLALSQKAIWALLGSASLYFSLVEWLHRNIPLTIVSTQLDLYVESSDGSDARVVKTQVIRANREDVTGYQTKFWADPAVDRSTIPSESISMHVDHCGADQQDYMILSGTPKSWVIMHRFPPIPLHFYTLGLNTVRRIEQYKQLCSFGSDVEWYDVVVPQMYRHKRLTLTVYFHKDNPCVTRECKGYWIANHGAVERHLQEVTDNTGRSGIRLKVRSPVRGDTYRIVWRCQRRL